MQDLLIGWFGDFTLIVIPVFAGIICSFIIEAVNQATPEIIKGKYLTAVICLIVGIFLVFGFPKVVTNWFDMVLIIVMNWAFAVSFYKLAGKVVVQKVIGKAINVISKKTDE